MDTQKGFLFIGDVLQVSNVNEYELIPNHVLKKASFEQIIQIKNYIPQPDFTKRYEIEKLENTETYASYTNLEEVKWKYWIIEYNGIQADIDLETSLLLSNSDIHILFEVLPMGAIMSTSVRLHNYISDEKMQFGNKTIEERALSEVKKTYTLIKEFENRRKDDYLYINKALKDFYNLREISHKSAFYVVAIFSIIESLLTHNVKGEGDKGLSFQLKTKLNLLNNRFEEKIDFRKYFRGSDTNSFEKIIEKLYSFRSDIAHGDFANFNRDLFMIAGPEKAREFLYALLKKTIKQALIEPQLISDLKCC